MNIVGIIPARYASTRFPAKALADIAGKSMIQRVYEQATKSLLLKEVIVATDHQTIFDHVLNFGGKVVLTNSNHPSGTDRVFEAVNQLKSNFDVVINIQGDEPFIEPNIIDLLASSFNKKTIQIATIASQITDIEDVFNSNVVKIVKDINGRALYFSRNPIPFVRNHPKDEWLNFTSFYRHIGLYGYRTEVLNEIVKLPVSPLESAESLEQLRWLEAGFQIYIQTTDYESFGIDTPNDLAKALNHIKI